MAIVFLLTAISVVIYVPLYIVELRFSDVYCIFHIVLVYLLLIFALNFPASYRIVSCEQVYIKNLNSYQVTYYLNRNEKLYIKHKIQQEKIDENEVVGTYVGLFKSDVQPIYYINENK